MKNKNCEKKLIILFWICLFVILTLGISAPAMAINSVWTTTPPSIDGVFSSNEWNMSAPENFSVIFDYGGLTTYLAPCTMYVNNDATNLYVVIIVDDPGGASPNLLRFAFDSNNNGSTDVNDDFIQTYR